MTVREAFGKGAQSPLAPILPGCRRAGGHVAGGDLGKVGMGIHIRTEGPDIVVEFHRKLVPRDRDIREYCEEIWQVAPVTVSLEA